MDYKVGDKVKIRSDLQEWVSYSRNNWTHMVLCSASMKYLWKEMTIIRIDHDWDLLFLEDDDRLCWTTWMIEPVSTVVTKPTYERKAERSDGITFERNAIWGRSLKEIEESISERKESIKRDESLLRSHRSLFGKKSCNVK